MIWRYCPHVIFCLSIVCCVLSFWIADPIYAISLGIAGGGMALASLLIIVEEGLK